MTEPVEQAAGHNKGEPIFVDCRQHYNIWQTLVYGFVAYILAYYFAFLLRSSFELYFSVVILAQGPKAIEKAGAYLLVAHVGFFNVLLLTLIWYFVRRRGYRLSEYYETESFGLKTAFLLLAALATLALFVWICGAAVSRGWMEPRKPFPGIGAPPSTIFLACILLAPVAEEIFWRGFVFSGFARSALGPWTGIIIVSIMWALNHPQYSLWARLFIVPIGILLGCVRHYGRTMSAPIMIHGLWNLFVLLPALR